MIPFKQTEQSWMNLFKSTGKNISDSSRLVLARGERFPEEVAAARLALSLGDWEVSPHHLLPDSHLLALQLGEHLVSSHEFRHKFQQEQVSEILKEDGEGKELRMRFRCPFQPF